jgi:hypothetical protein
MVDNNNSNNKDLIQSDNPLAISQVPSQKPHLAKHAHRFLLIYLGLIIIILLAGGLYEWHHKHTTSLNNSKSLNYNSEASTARVVKYTNWSSTPSDIKQAVTIAWEKSSPEYKSKPTITCNPNTIPASIASGGSVYVSGNFVVVGVGCNIHTTNLVVKENGIWTDVAQAEQAFTCKTLSQYNVPKSIVLSAFASPTNTTEVSCIESNGAFLTLTK